MVRIPVWFTVLAVTQLLRGSTAASLAQDGELLQQMALENDDKLEAKNMAAAEPSQERKQLFETPNGEFENDEEKVEQSRRGIDYSINFKPRDCADVYANGDRESGVYTVYVGSLKRRVQVYCDMTTDGGGWTVFQRRQDGSVSFQQGWTAYERGFGKVDGEYWLGNDYLHSMTSSRNYELRIDMRMWNNTAAYALYSNFKIGSGSICDKYKLLSVGTYCGTAGDSLAYHVGMKFSTPDQDNDAYAPGACAVMYKGAWWYNGCHYANLNGIYFRDGPHVSYADGVDWFHWAGHHYSLKFVEMKIRPTDA